MLPNRLQDLLLKTMIGIGVITSNEHIIVQDELATPEPIIQEVIHEVEATFYTSKCNGCTGYTKYKSHDVRNTIYVEGYRVIAVDPKLIKLGTIVSVTLENGMSFEAIASDIGGDIKNNRIDVLVSTKKEAYSLGRQKAYVRIIRNSEQK